MSSLTKCRGLHTNHNELAVPEGALVQADNINIDENDNITSRPGFSNYGDDFPAITDRAKQLSVYKDRLIRHFGSTLQYDSDGSGTFSAFSGSYSEIDTGLRIKSIESNSNFYFTTNDGIKKISATTSSDFVTTSGFIVDSGVPKGLDIQATLDYISTGFLTADNQVGYRIVWGYTDVNNNLLLGSPSERVTISNAASNSYTSITGNGSGKCRISDVAHGLENNDIITISGCTESSYNTNHTVTVIDVDTFDTDIDVAELAGAITLANDCKAKYNAHIADGTEHTAGADSTNTIVADNATTYATLIVLVTELIAATTSYDAHNQDLIDGAPAFHEANVAGATAYDLTSLVAPTTLDEAITKMNDFQAKYDAHDLDAAGHLNGNQHQTTESAATAVQSYSDGTWSYTCQISLTFTIPNDANSTDYFYHIYRTGLSGTASTNPGDEMYLVFEEQLTATDISNGYVTLSNENYPESFRESALPLYTNEVTGDGILQSNDRPPVAKDIALFRESVFYANTKTLQRQTITLTDVSNIVTGTSKFIIGNATDTRIYNFETTENIGSLNVKVFTLGTASQNIRDTAKSLIHVINRDSSGLVFAYYASGSDDLPGIIEFEARTLSDTAIDFGVVSSIGGDFSPTISETVAITGVSIHASTPTVTTGSAHGYSVGDSVYVYCSDSTPVINGTYTILTVPISTTFTISETTTGSGTAGYTFTVLVYTDNNESANRIYFSKTGQPEAVPSTNWVPVGGKDSAIKRIMALRDNLFVLKEDGVYIISGSTAPDFTARLLDPSVSFQAADTAVVLNNKIYALSNQGVVTVSEAGGVAIISTVIKDLILAVTSDRFSNYDTYSFGVGYETDRSYHIWLPTNINDTYATQCYRYNISTKAWTRWIKNSTCGIVSADDKLYLGDGANEHILQERKTDDRTDFSDLTTSTAVSQDGVSSTTIQLDSITNVDVGDAIVQTQYVTAARFNRLLNKLDIDPGLTDTDYNSSLSMSAGDSPYTQVSLLMTKLTTDDSGKTYTYDNPTTYTGLQTTYNTIITNLNAVDSDAFFSNYESISSSVVYETVITEKATSGNFITVSVALSFLEGEIVIHDGYVKTIVWAPQHFGDPSIFKQISEGSIFFDGNSYTNAKIAFATDLSPSFSENDYNGAGTGTFGSASFGETVFGGEGTDKPFRDLIPLEKQRCRYISVRFKHLNARESFVIVGISLKMRPYSSKAYRGI